MGPKTKAPEKGLCFPKDTKGGRSTSDAGKKIIAAALRGAGTADGDRYAAMCEKERNWRFGYVKHFKNLVKVSASSPQAALGCAQAGADYMHDSFEFIAPLSGKEHASFGGYMSGYKANQSGDPSPFFTGTIKGTRKGTKPLSVSYKGKDLTGDALKKQVMKWAEYGTIEADAADALLSLASNSSIDLKGKHFVLIGAGSAMGPYAKLLEHGATVVCIDIPGMWGDRPAAMWSRLIKIARESSGEIIFPLNAKQETCKDDDALFKAVGCNLTEYPAQILYWLQDVAKGQPLTVGNYTYLDGELHVKLSLAADAIIAGLCAKRNDTRVAFLCTPTDLHVITDEAHAAAVKNYGWHPGRLIEAFFNIASMGKWLKKNVERPLATDTNKTIKTVDGLSVAQGPNYALAKRLQHWRAMIAFENGHIVSSNIAPSTATLSVVSNRTFGWAYGGMPYFKPYEIFQQETTNAVMAGMLVHDVTNASSAAHPKNRSKFGIDNTMELFKFNSVHGGVWRSAYTVNSIGEVSVLIHFLGGPALFLPVMLLLFLAVVGGGAFHLGYIQ